MKQLSKTAGLLGLAMVILGPSALAQSLPAGTVITNQGSADYLRSDGSRGSVDSNTVRTTIQPICSLSILPDGTVANPGQVQRSLGLPVTFTYTVTNTGNLTSTYPLTARLEQGSAPQSVAVYVDTNGNGVAEAGEAASSVTLAAGAAAQVLVVVDPASSGESYFNLIGSCPGGTASDSNNVAALLTGAAPTIVKSSSVAENQPLQLGGALTYTITVTNPNDYPLQGVVVTDPLPQGLDFVSATAPGVFSNGVVTWNLGTLPARARVELVVQTTVNNAAIGSTLVNTAQLTQPELPAPVPSNPVTNSVKFEVNIEKTVSPQQARPGDVLTYTLELTNLSRTTPIEGEIVDTPAPGLEYVAGSSRLEGVAIADPRRDGASLIWNVTTLPPSTPLTLTYQMRVTPEATGELNNVVTLLGKKGAVDIDSDFAEAAIRVDLQQFAPFSDLIGTVYIDRNRNRQFDKDLDTPVERARVILAGGRLVQTDKLGRYHFANVPLGTHALRLDLNTTPYAPLSMPAEWGLVGTQSVHVRGLTSVDFPLAPVGGDIAAIRTVTVQSGDLTLVKTVYRVRDPQNTADDGLERYTVTFDLQSPAEQPGLTITDPLPEGATLLEGSNGWSGTVPAGETRHSYSFSARDLSSEQVVTDPVLEWRNP